MDFDGLILDTEGPIYQAWLEIFEEFGAELPLSAWEVWLGGSPDMFDPCGYLESQLGRAVDREARCPALRITSPMPSVWD